MRNRIVILISFLVIFCGSALAAGVMTRPQSEREYQPSYPAQTSMPGQMQPTTQTPILNPLQTNQEPQDLPKIEPVPPILKPDDRARKTFQPIIEPIQKALKPLQIAACEEVTTYKKLSLPEAIDFAMKNNIEIKEARLDVSKAKNDIKTANRLRNPYIQSLINGGKAATDNPDFVGLIFPIDIAKRGPRKKFAQSVLELTKGNTLLQELNLRLDVRQSYVDLVAAKSMLKILDDQRQLLQDLLNIAQKKYEVGAVPQMDVIHAKMTLNQLLIQLNSARTDVLVARYKFNMILDAQGYDTKEDYLPEQKEFADMLTPKPYEKLPDFKTVEAIAMANRIDIKIAKQDIDVATKNLTVIIRQLVPDIEIGGGYMVVPAGMATSGTTADGWYAIANINNIPLLYQYKPEIKNARIQVEQKQLLYDAAKHHALMNLHSAYDSFCTAQTNLNYYTDVLLAESSQFLHMAKRSYIVGKTSITDLIFIEQSYKNIIMGYTTALANYYNSWVDLLREVNDEDLKLNG